MIDANALLKKSMMVDLNGGRIAVVAIKHIDAAPTIEKRGEWILVGKNSHDYETSLEEKCSLCGRYVYRYDTQPQDNYCPNCGCRMEK